MSVRGKEKPWPPVLCIVTAGCQSLSVEQTRAIITIAAVCIACAHAEAEQRANAQQDSSKLRSINSQYFTEYASLTTIPTLLTLSDNQGSGSFFVSRTVHAQAGPGNEARFNLASYLYQQTLNADLVITGRPLSYFSALTRDQDFVFTDYVFQVDTVEKDPTHSVQPGDHIVVSRAGGILSYAGRTIHAVDPNFPAFVEHNRYILFLHTLPGDTAFKVTSDGAFTLNDLDGKVYHRSAESLNKSGPEFLNDVRRAVQATKQ